MTAADFTSEIRFEQGQTIRKARKALGLSLDQTSKALGHSGDGSFISRIELGRFEPSLELKMQLVRILEDGGLTLADILSPAEGQLLEDMCGCLDSHPLTAV